MRLASAVQRAAATQAHLLEFLGGHALRAAIDSLVDSEQQLPLVPVHWVHPSVGEDAILQEHVHVHVVVDQVVEAQAFENFGIRSAFSSVEKKPLVPFNTLLEQTNEKLP